VARRVITKLVDDLDGSELGEGKGTTVRFAFDGASYEIDLSDKNAKKFKQTLDPYIQAGRKLKRESKSRSGSAGRDYDPKVVRAWAIEQGIPVPERGRIPESILDQYRG
jgi:Lsr2